MYDLSTKLFTIFRISMFCRFFISCKIPRKGQRTVSTLIINPPFEHLLDIFHFSGLSDFVFATTIRSTFLHIPTLFGTFARLTRRLKLPRRRSSPHSRLPNNRFLPSLRHTRQPSQLLLQPDSTSTRSLVIVRPNVCNSTLSHFPLVHLFTARI